MDQLSSLLLQVTSALLVPVVGGLLLLAGVVLLLLGGLGGEAVERLRHGPALRGCVEALQAHPTRRLAASAVPARFGLPRRGLASIQARPGGVGKVLDDLQLEAERRLSLLLLGIRLGPILGLAGTLIPLGPALVTLSTGDVAALSERLVVAFATTVLGLLIGGVCFVMHTLRKQWYMQDLNDVEYITQRLEVRDETPAATPGE